MQHNWKTVVVLGMHRSGTSLTAGILKRLGINMGRRLVRRTGSNPLGHFEDRRFVRLNDRILRAAGGDSFHPPAPEAILEQGKNFTRQIKRLVRRGGNWGWKDPRTCLTMELFHPYLRIPYFIVCHRPAMDVAESLRKRNELAVEEGLVLQEIYEQRIGQYFAEHPESPRMDLDYREIISQPVTCVAKIGSFLELRVPSRRFLAAAAMVQPKDRLRQMAESLRKRDAFHARLKQIEKQWRSRRDRLLGKRTR